MLVYIKSIE